MKPVKSPYRVSFEEDFRLADAPTEPPDDTPDKQTLKKQLEDVRKELAELQRIFYAFDRHSLLLVFQAMDAAGKDSTIRHVFSGVNPAGFQVSSFKQPSKEELDHDFLWRTTRRLPERGRIGVFNRSYYEEVLVVRVHPEFLGSQNLPEVPALEDLWPQRFRSIRNYEQHLADNGTAILKFWLNVSKKEQKKRFRARLDRPDKNWKFSEGDLDEREHWAAYMEAYEAALNATSREYAPWYAIPADSKPFMRLQVARIVAECLQSMGLRYPELDRDTLDRLDALRERLEAS